MNETLKLGLVLLLVCAISGGVLAVSNSITAPIIAEIEKEGSMGAFGEFFPEADDMVAVDEALLADIMSNNSFVKEIYEVKKSEEIIGYAFKTVSNGYGGDIVAVSGFNMDGTIAGIKVVEHGETPNLGGKIEEEPFRGSFTGKNSANELVPSEAPSADNEVLLISGATVSTKGVLAGINGAREAFVDNFLN